MSKKRGKIKLERGRIEIEWKKKIEETRRY